MNSLNEYRHFVDDYDAFNDADEYQSLQTRDQEEYFHHQGASIYQILHFNYSATWC